METINLEQLSRVTGGACADQQQPQQPQGDDQQQGASQSGSPMGSLGGIDQLLAGFQQVLAGFQQLLASFGGGQAAGAQQPQQPQAAGE